MACTCPQDVYPPAPGASSRRVVWGPNNSYSGAKSFRIPCGQCLGCRLDKSGQLATRCVHESQMHEFSWFATFTLSDEHYPDDSSVSKRCAQLGLKRIRNNLGRFRYLFCGEYGDDTKRAHYHALLFGLELPDRYLWRRDQRTGDVFYRSPSLEAAWGLGHVEFSFVTLQSAGYVARYQVKKLTGKLAADAYMRVNAQTGEVYQVQPEFLLSSRRPGLGFSWFLKFRSDAFPRDYVVVDGQRRPMPAFYKRKLSERDQLKLTAKRKISARLHADNNTERRLITRHESQRLKAARLIRPFGG